jgi:hypothetical protein
MKVFPLADGLCPACGQFNFKLTPVDPKAVAAAQAAASLAVRARVREADTLYWQLVWSVSALVALIVGGTYVRHYGTGFLGQPPPDKTLVTFIVGVAGVVAAWIAHRNAIELARTIQLVSGRTRTPGVFTVLKESMGFFEEHGVAVGRLGPRMRSFEPLESDVIE